jgi:tetratricopeptide (TPR) repeat protein
MTRLSTNSIHSVGSSSLPRHCMAVVWLLAFSAALAAIPARTAKAAPTEERTPPGSDSVSTGLFGKSQAYLDMLERYLTLMEKFARLTEDPAASGSAAVLSAREILTSDGDASKAIDYFTQVLPDVKNEAVQRTIHIELSELYKHAGQKDKALEQLRILMVSAPPEVPRMPPPLSHATPAQRP